MQPDKFPRRITHWKCVSVIDENKKTIKSVLDRTENGNLLSLNLPWPTNTHVSHREEAMDSFSAPEDQLFHRVFQPDGPWLGLYFISIT